MLDNQQLIELLQALSERRSSTPYAFDTTTGQKKKQDQDQDQSGGGMDYQQIMDMIQQEPGATTAESPSYEPGPYTDSGSSASSMSYGGEPLAYEAGTFGGEAALGGEAAGSTSSAGEGAMGSSAGIYAIIAAIIGGQMALSNNTDTEIEGQESGHWFSGIEKGQWDPAPANEPWLAKVHDQMGWEPTAGEKFDAAFRNDDWGTALKRLPAAADYYADPIRNWAGYDTWKNIVGEDFAKLLDPIGGLLSQIEGWF